MAPSWSVYLDTWPDSVLFLCLNDAAGSSLWKTAAWIYLCYFWYLESKTQGKSLCCLGSLNGNWNQMQVLIDLSFAGGTSGKELAYQYRRQKFDQVRQKFGPGRFPGGGHGIWFQYSCLENPMERVVWQTTVHSIAESDTTKVT